MSLSSEFNEVEWLHFRLREEREGFMICVERREEVFFILIVYRSKLKETKRRQLTDSSRRKETRIGASEKLGQTKLSNVMLIKEI